MTYLNRYAPVLGRVLITLVFVMSGLGKVTGFAATAGYIQSKGLPLPEAAAIIAIVIELGGSLMLIFGWKMRPVAAILLLYTVVVAFVFHKFWAVPPEQFMNQMNHFFKNISMAGGLLYVVTYCGIAPGTERRERK